jgi:hypothetical protein
MGDEELNFTEKEAQLWAGDPRNQGQEAEPFMHAFAICCLLVITILLCVWLSSIAAAHDDTAREMLLGALPFMQ